MPASLRRALPDTIAPDAPTPLWRAIDEAMDAFGDEDGEGRRVILVLSDGKDSGPISFRERYVSQAEVIDRARRDDVMVYAIGMRSRGRGRCSRASGLVASRRRLLADLPDAGLALVAEQTGGGYAEIRLRTGSRRRIRPRRRRAAQPVPPRLRSAEARRQGARHRRARRHSGA